MLSYLDGSHHLIVNQIDWSDYDKELNVNTFVNEELFKPALVLTVTVCPLVLVTLSITAYKKLF